MVFRFAGAMALVVIVALIGAALETRAVAVRRQIVKQHYQLEALEERLVRLRLAIQQEGTPTRLLAPLESGQLTVKLPERPNRTAQRPTALPEGTVRH